MKRLAERAPVTKGIALSGRGMECDLQSSREAGFGVHLTKPMSDPLPGGLERLTGDNSTRRILDLDVPMTTLPVMPGRNLAVLTEAATRLHSLRMKGLDPAAAFIARHSNFLERGES